MDRRAFLRSASAVPLAAPFAAEAVARELTGAKIGTAMGINAGPVAEGNGVGKSIRFRDWASYWTKRREDVVRDAHFVNRIDPDIASMASLPLNSKFAMQRRRNIAREKANLERWFEKQIGMHGFLEYFE